MFSYHQTRDGDVVRVSEHERGAPGTGPDAESGKARKNHDSSADDTKGNSPPIINLKADRIANVLADAPARFEIVDDGKADSTKQWYNIHSLGVAAVEKHADTIKAEATRQGVDPDLVKAIMYMENADGHWGGMNPLADVIGVSNSKLPMNIRPDFWGDLGIDEASAGDPAINIRASVTLIRRIQDRLDDPSPEKVAALWNNIALEKLNDVGARVGAYFRTRRWEKPVGQNSGISRARSR